MKPSDESRYTAWIDGALSEEEAVQFEKELSAKGFSLAEMREAQREAEQLGSLLRANLKTPPLRNADFFNQEILRQIEAETPRPSKAEKTGSSSNPFWRLFLLSAYCSVAAFFFYATLSSQVVKPPPYYAQFYDTEAGDLGISAVPFHADAENLTVLWLDGLDDVTYADAGNPKTNRLGGKP